MFNKPEIGFGDNSKLTSKVETQKGSSQREMLSIVCDGGLARDCGQRARDCGQRPATAGSGAGGDCRTLG